MPKTIKTTYTAINLETGEVYTGIDAPQSITRGETHFWQASKDFFATLLGYTVDDNKDYDQFLAYEWKTVRAWEAKDGKMIFYILPPRGKKAKP